MSRLAQSRFGVLGPLHNARSSWMESWGGHGKSPPLSGSGAGSRTCTVSAGHGPLPSGWFWGEELRFHAEFSRTVCTDGPDEECRVNLLLVGTGDSRLTGKRSLQEHPLGMHALN